ncbi:glycosyltransferase [Polaribacter sp. PL03]|uniref:glycosyltransferase n=1 Tax=Polaribacter sp. PL03 TaxID=3088353 RepID=UPI0029CCB7C7|nr:glycosyltransferase [Polaribacter sp. PL03]MDX6746057.1 glycosyltransferase [Polaribacter sp. PL03]
MRFLIISDAPTLKKGDKLFSYAPYVNEMKLWIKYFDDVVIVSPTKYKKDLLVDSFNRDVKVSSIPSVSLISFFEILKSIIVLPFILLKLFKNMKKADHIHLRNPGSIGLLACFIQVFFPFTPKTSKYAGNWDPKSEQPLSYKLQKWILSNSFLTRNCKVLVYGEWANQSKNIVPFFTASYNKSEIEPIENKSLTGIIKFIFVGAFTKGKQPFLCVRIIENLISKGYNVQLDMFGNGEEFLKIQEYIHLNSLSENIILHGNQSKNVVKKAFIKSHFLLFISKSEGWPKVVAEAMFWKCLPIASNVSCVNYMLDSGNRGIVVDANINEKILLENIISILNDNTAYQKKVMQAQEWSQNYTLDKFEVEIKKLINNE